MLGDGEGANEMTESINMIREFCDRLLAPEKARTTRIVCNLLIFVIQMMINLTSIKVFYNMISVLPGSKRSQICSKNCLWRNLL